MKAELIQTITEDELILNGLYLDGDKNKPVTILIHGFTSDFYSHKFFHLIQEGLSQSGFASCAIQNRGTGIQTEFIKKDRKDGKWIGSFSELLEEAHLDISAWIEKLRELGYSKFVLAGHSLGTIKTVRYMTEGEYKDQVTGLVLLAPFDKNGYIEKFTKGKWLEYQKESEKKVTENEGEKTIPSSYDDYPMSYQNYASWYKPTELNKIWDFYKGENYDGKVLQQIKIPVQVIVGDKDEFFYIPEFSRIEEAQKILEDNIEDLDMNIIKGAEHTYVGYEDRVSSKLLSFVEGL